MFSMCLHVWKKLIKMTTVIKNTKKKLWKEVYERYQKISKEEKDKRQKKAQERYQNFTEEENRRVDRNISEGKKKETSWA